MTVVAIGACLAAVAIVAAVVAWFSLRRKPISGLWLLSVPLVISSFLAETLTPNIAGTLIFGLGNPQRSDIVLYFIHSFIHLTGLNKLAYVSSTVIDSVDDAKLKFSLCP